MTITGSYIPAPTQTDQQAQARAQALGVGIAPRDIPPVYQPFVTSVPGVVAEYGTVIFVADDGTLTSAQVTAALVPLVAQKTADQTTASNQQTILARAHSALTANATYLAIPTPTTAQAVAQVATLTKEVSALVRLIIQQFDSVSGT